MAVIKVPTNFNIDVEFEIPEFYRRMLALLVDMIIEFCYVYVAIRILSNLYPNSDDDAMRAYSWLLFAPYFLYHLIMEITLNGQSLGKKLMGLRVVNENGGKASIGQFLIRWFLRVSDVWIVSLLVIIAFSNRFRKDAERTFFILAALGFLITDIALVVNSKKGQRIGDILAHTILIRTHSKASIEETVFQEVADNYIPSFPQIMQLSDKDINAIKSILQTAQKKGDYIMALSASDKIKGHLKIESSLSPFDFLEILLKDYNYLSTK